MKRYSIPIYLFVFLLLPGLATGDDRVRFVYDGDTVLLESGERVRYVGIDTPEMGDDDRPPEYLAEAARAFNERATRGKRLRLEFDRERRDRHGRLLAYVLLPDGRMLNRELVQRGLARVLATRPNLKHLGMLIEAQRRAMARRKGIWGREATDAKGPYVGSRRSYRFHRPDCPYAGRIHRENRVRFHSLRSAFWEGYSPCSRCFRQVP